MRNNFEKDIYKSLCRKYGKDNVEYEPFSLDYVLHFTYTPDFLVAPNGGEDSTDRFILETKGYFRPKDRRLLKAVKEQHPDQDLRIIFQQDKKLDKYAKSKYSDWAERAGFNYAVGRVPRDW